MKDRGEGFVKEFINLASIDSTNRYALDHGKPFAAITADRQEAGRGRRGHQWHSPKGNLYLTITLPGMDTRYTVLAGVAARNVIAGLLPERAVLIKWPNDIIADGKKIAGILCESRAAITAVGIGVNVNQTDWPDELISKATSLKLLSGRCYENSDISNLITGSIGKWYETYKKNGFTPVRECFLRHHIKSGYRPMLSDGTEIIVKDIDSEGFLVVDINGESKTLVNEELFFSGYTDL